MSQAHAHLPPDRVYPFDARGVARVQFAQI